MPHALLYPKGGLVLVRNDGAAEEWGALSARALNPSAIYYEPIINSRKVQGERNEDGERVVTGSQEGGGNEY